MKTKTAFIGFSGREKITCINTGKKDPWEKVIWQDVETGKYYDLAYAKFSRMYAFRPLSDSIMEIAK